MTTMDREAFRRTLRDSLLSKERSGHPFRGNQYTRGVSGGVDRTSGMGGHGASTHASNPYSRREAQIEGQMAAVRLARSKKRKAKASGVVGASRSIADLKAMASPKKNHTGSGLLADGPWNGPIDSSPPKYGISRGTDGSWTVKHKKSGRTVGSVKKNPNGRWSASHTSSSVPQRLQTYRNGVDAVNAIVTTHESERAYHASRKKSKRSK